MRLTVIASAGLILYDLRVPRNWFLLKPSEIPLSIETRFRPLTGPVFYLPLHPMRFFAIANWLQFGCVIRVAVSGSVLRDFAMHVKRPGNS